MSVLYQLAVGCVLISLAVATEKPCCVSKKWTGKMKITTAYVPSGSSMPVLTENRLSFDYDRDMRMEKAAGTVLTINGSMETTTDYLVINDYRHMRKYVLTRDSGCNVETLTGDQIEPCIPKTLHWNGNYTIGSTSEGVHVNTWSGDYENYHYNILSTVDDCTPVVTNRFGTTADGTRISEEIAYADVTQYMTSPGAFDLPDSCKQAVIPVGK